MTALLAERVGQLGDAVRQAAALPEPAALGAFDARRILTTGLGSSAANARFLASLLADELGLPAAFVPTPRLVAAPPPGAERDLLIVFSQGLSPNARAALRHVASWGRLVLVTSLGESSESASLKGGGGAGGGGERDRALDAAQAAGVLCLPLGVEREFGMLARVLGPMAGYVVAFAIARVLGQRAGLDVSRCRLDVERICLAIESAPAAVDAAFPPGEALAPLLDRPTCLLCAGGVAEQLAHLPIKVLEGMWRPLPPLWDVLDFAHGPFQSLVSRAATLLCFARAGVAGEADALARLAQMLTPERHALRVLRASASGPEAIFEHEAQLDHLMLRDARERGLALEDWPGKGGDAALYALDGARDALPAASDTPRARPSESRPLPSESRQLGELRWPELGERLAQGDATALVALGSTEQHGPHLPLATDSQIAAALARGLCSRIPGSLALPVIEFGCASEHMGFPGTIHLEAETLEAMLGDILASLARHGFARAFVFSAHGGNLGPLRAMQPRLVEAARPMQLVLAAEAGLAALWHASSAEHGVSAAASGQHAGEFETSILEALAPAQVARALRAPGTLAVGEAQELFYPDLRANAPSGVVGDPTASDPTRAAGYLARWVDALVAAYEGAVRR